MPRRLLLPLLALLLALPAPAHAQDPQPTAFLLALDAAGFPQVSVRLCAAGADGRSLTGLDGASIRLEEDGRPVRALTVAREEVGLRLVFVLHTTPAFRTRDVLGNSRLDYVKQFLLAWAREGGPVRAGVDDLTLLTPEGALLAHSASPAEFLEAVAGYEPKYEPEVSGFQLLQQGLTLASDPLPRVGMRRVVVMISPPLPALNEVPISDALSRAGQMRTPIHTLLVGPEGSVDQPGAATLQRLASGSGGIFAYFDSPQAGGPLLELAPGYRLQYLLSYRSTLSTSGRHQLVASVQAGDLSLTTPPLEFALSVEPAAVAFVSPPSALSRRSSDPTLAVAALPPTEHNLRVIIEFPDGHPRAIVRSQLLVDGEVVGERRQAPFDRFVWDLSGYDATAVRRLRAVVTDELGLQGRSIEIPVQVAVQVERSPVRRIEPYLRPLAILGSIVLAGALLALLVTISLRRPRPRQPVSRQPVEAPRPPPRARPRRGKAFLEIIPPEAGAPGAGQRRIELAEPVTSLGRDPAQVQAVFEDQSVSRRHARIEHHGGDRFLLFDENSTSGTWVNLGPVGQAGALLRHGDRINLGRVVLVFHLRSARRGDTEPGVPVSTQDTGPVPPAHAPDGQETRPFLPGGEG